MEDRKCGIVVVKFFFFTIFTVFITAAGVTYFLVKEGKLSIDDLSIAQSRVLSFLEMNHQKTGEAISTEIQERILKQSPTCYEPMKKEALVRMERLQGLQILKDNRIRLPGSTQEGSDTVYSLCKTISGSWFFVFNWKESPAEVLVERNFGKPVTIRVLSGQPSFGFTPNLPSVSDQEMHLILSQTWGKMEIKGIAPNSSFIVEANLPHEENLFFSSGLILGSIVLEQNYAGKSIISVGSKVTSIKIVGAAVDFAPGIVSQVEDGKITKVETEASDAPNAKELADGKGGTVPVQVPLTNENAPLPNGK
jgi:hypothetical protein